MEEFIKNLGYTNFYIIIGVVVVIVLLLVVVLIMEKTNASKRYKDAIDEIEVEENSKDEEENDLYEERQKQKKLLEEQKKKFEQEQERLKEEQERIKETQRKIKDEQQRQEKINIEKRKQEELEQEKIKQLEIEKIKAKKQQEALNEKIIKYRDDNKKNKIKEEVTYDEHKNTKEEAKEKLDEVTKKLEDKKAVEGPTYFEKEQEEMSIISYDELKKLSYNIDESNDKLLEDEGDEPITIEELYQRQVEKEMQENADEPEGVANPLFEETMDYTANFKKSDVISPVFGVKNKDKKHTDYNKEDYDRTMDLSELESEIKRTEDFLKELKNLKNKLNQ